MGTNLEALAHQMKALTPSNQLRLAATLLERQTPDTQAIAQTLVQRVLDEIALADLLKRARGDR